MSNQWMQPDDDFDEEDDQGQQAQLPKGFRTQLSKVQKENKDLKEANDKLLRQVRETVISQALSAKGVNAKVAKLIPSDIEPTPEALDKWLADYSELFAPKPAEGAPSGEAGEESSEEGGEESPEGAEYAAQMGRMSEIANGAQAPKGKPSELLKQLADPSMTHEKLIELIHAHGGGAGAG